MRRGPSRTGYLNIPGTNACLENTSLHRENFVRVDKLHARAAQHDSDRTIFLRRKVNRSLYRRIRDVFSANLVMQPNLREDPRILRRSFCVGLDFERREGDALLLQDQDDVRGGTGHHREERSLDRARTLPSLSLARIEEDLRGLL